MNVLRCLFGTVLISCFACSGNFDNSIAEKDLKTYFPNCQIKQISSDPCDGSFGDCYYVTIQFIKDENAKFTDTTLQYQKSEQWILNKSKKEKTLSDRERLKRLAFCNCMYKANPASDFWKDQGSASGYFELGEFSAETAMEINKKAG